MPNEITIVLDARHLVQLANVALFANSDKYRPVLSGVLIEVTADEVRAVATDSYVLAWEELKCDHNGEGSFVVPATEIVKWSKVASQVATIRLDNFTATFSNGETTMTTRVVEGEYPNYRNLAPKGDGEPTENIGLRADLLAQIGKVRDPNNPKNRKLAVRFTLYGPLKPCVGTIGSLSFLQIPVKLS